MNTTHIWVSIETESITTDLANSVFNEDYEVILKTMTTLGAQENKERKTRTKQRLFPEF